MKKRIIAFLIVAVMILTCTVSVYAEALGEVETTVYTDETTEETIDETEETSESPYVEESSTSEEKLETLEELYPDLEGEFRIGTDGEVEILVKMVKKGLEFCYEFVKFFVDQSKATELSGTYYFSEDVDLGPIKVGKEGLTMIIADGVTVTCDASTYDNYAGIKAAYNDRPLFITAGAPQNPDGSYPEIKGTGTLIAKGGRFGAGIGCSTTEGFDAHQITISSCNVYAYGGEGAAGIGGGENGHLTDLTINGGYVEAHGGYKAAGIGSGAVGICGIGGSHDITINGGTVIAYGDECAAGIGGGQDADAYDIYINENIPGVSTYVEAHGGYGGAGIGGGDGNGLSPHGYDITITGGTIKAYGGAKKNDSNKGGAGIGSGARQKAWGITITGGDVTAIGGGSAAGIGGGSEGEGYDITISGGTINAISGGDGNGAGIGSGRGNSAKRITISGGDITATSNGNGAGIGAGEKGELKKDSYGIQISGGYIVATSNGNGAGLGSGSEKKAEGIDINGGTIVATSKGSGAGIGGGYKGEGKNITINDGYITAESKDGGAGIGGGYKGKANNININGGLIEAFGSTKDSYKGYGLGQGGNGSQEKIYVKTNVLSYHSDDKTVWTPYPAKSGDLSKDGDWNKLNYSGFKTKTAETPSITLGAQVGSPQYGTDGTSLYIVNTSYVSGENWDINWYSDAEGTIPCDAPADVTTYESTDSCGIINGATTPAGTWYFTLSCGGITSNVAKYTVAKLNASITSGSASKVYDGTPLTCETYEVSGFLAGEGVNVTCTGSQTDVGFSANTFNYAPKSGTDLNNYNITETEGTLKVVSEPFVVTGENYSGLYDGDAYAFNVKVTGKNGKDLTSASSIKYSSSNDGSTWSDWTSTAPEITDAGTLYVQAKATYNSVEAVSSKYTMTVNRRNIILTSESAQREYDGTALTSTGVEVSGDGFVGAEGFESAPVATGSITKVGSVPNDIADVSFNAATKSANYKIVKKPGTLSVIPKSAPITITTPSDSKKYDGTAIGVGTVSYTSGILASGDNLTVTLSRIGDNAVKDAGNYDNGIDSYQVTNGSGEDVTNCYTFAEPVIGHLNIDRRYITLTSESEVFIYDGSEHSATDITLSGDGLVAGETLAYSDHAVVKEITAEPVDNTFTYSGGGNFNSANYYIITEYGKLSVVAQIGVVGADVETFYDGTSKEAPAEVIGTAKSPEYSTSVDGKTWSSYTATVPSMKNAGTLYIKAKVEDQSQIAEASYTLIVKPRPVTIGTKSASKPYDGTALTANNGTDVIISGQGFVAGDAPNITITGSQTDLGSSKNSFKYVFSGNKEDNYDITEEPGTLTVTVNDKPIVINSGSDEQVYNGMPLSNTDYTVFWGGKEVVDNKLCGTDVLKVTPVASITEVGSINNEFYYQVIRDGVDVTDCYTFGELNEGTLVVTKRSVVINTASDEKVYDGTALTNNSYTITGDGFVAGEGFETVNIVGSRLNAGTAENALDSVAPYSFKAGTNEANYEVYVVAGTLKVNKRKVSVASGSAISTYAYCPSEGISNTAQCTVSGDGFVSGEMESGYPKGEVILGKPNTEPDIGNPATADNTIAYNWTGNGNPANYEITENLGKLVITNNSEARAIATDYVGVYDGNSHGGSVVTTLEGATVEYSTDGKDVTDPSKEWATLAPTKTDASTTKVDVRITKGSDTAYCSYTITITKRDLTLTAGSAEKVYDGTALTCSDYTIGGDGYADGESAEIVIGTMSGNELVDVGTDKNVVKKLKAKNGFKGSNYKISSFEGTLEITKRPVIIISKALGLTPQNVVAPETAEATLLSTAYEYAILSGSPMGEVLYDGTKHTQNEVVEVGNTSKGGLKDIPNMGFVGDQGLNYSNFEEATDAGFYKNAFDYSVKANTNLNNYDLKVYEGVIKITPRKIILTSGSAQKKYDGTPLVCETMEVGGDGFVAGEGADYEYLGSQTEVGKSSNPFKYELKDGTNPINYDISDENLIEGTLEVYGNDTLRIVSPGNQSYTYDGNAHGEPAKAYIGDTPLSADMVWYSIDGGRTFESEESKVATDAGTYNVIAKTEKNGYVTASCEYTIEIAGKEGIVIVVPEETVIDYDGNPHKVDPKVTVDGKEDKDVDIEYSTDGGETWSETQPTRTDVGTTTVIIKVSKDNYADKTATYKITVKAKNVNTGDRSNTALWIILAAAAVLVLFGTFYAKRRKFF